MKSFRSEIENPVVEKDIIELEKKIFQFKNKQIDEEKFRSLRLARGVYYMVREPKQFLNQQLLISGGGDSALDWAIYFAENGNFPISLVYRSEQFRAHNYSVEKVFALQKAGKIVLYTHAEVKKVWGDHQLEGVELHQKKKPKTLFVKAWLPLFGLSPKLGPIANWGLYIEKNAIRVNHALDYQTNIPGIFAVGDVNTYPGKLKLILCGFHEATLAVQSAYKIVYPNKKFTLKYTTVQGIQGFKEDIATVV